MPQCPLRCSQHLALLHAAPAPPQLCRGASPEERAAYLLPPASELASFEYLSRSGCTSIAGVDDAADFGRVKSAMAAVG